MIPALLLPIANHLWQSTVFAAAAGLLTLLLRKNHAHTRYWLWLSASAKFLIPFSLLVAAGSQFGRHVALAPTASRVPMAIEQVSEPFGVAVALMPAQTPRPPRWINLLVPGLIGLWALGFAALALSWSRRYARLRSILRAATPMSLDIGVPVRSSPALLEPGVFGVLRPVLLLPEGVASELAPAELQAILAHELCHVRRRDNLATAMHMVVEAVFWFHPLVWWLGARLMDERERACDEEVLRSGTEAQAYAEGILKVCDLYLRSPLECVAGVTGANLTTRIEAIMNYRPALALNLVKKVGLAFAGALAIAIPVILGITNAPALRAQAQADLRFEAATIKRVDIPNTNAGRVPIFFPEGGPGTSDPHRYTSRGAQIIPLIATTFGVRGELITVPKGVGQDRYDIVANIPDGATKEQFNVMMGNLLRDRLHLRFHIESKVLPVYALRVAKGGPKFKESDAARRSDAKATGVGLDAEGFPMLPPGTSGMGSMPRTGELFTTAQDTPMANLARSVESPAAGVGRPVVDETGLTGHYDFKIRFQWGKQDPENPSGASTVFTALQEQLGLKLEPSTAPFDHLIIDSLDREPAEN